ncbi:MAG: hypothetical protein NT004_00710 [Bacteroidetes bacterium]|nr:hypothetical protein [Bacteroidota bacterium]
MKTLQRTTFLFGLFFLLLSGALRAQFTISGEFRPRFEYRDGYTKLRDSSKTPYLAILGRNRLIFDYKNDQFTARFSIQQAYVFGENNYSSDTITRNTINIYEGWFRYSFAKGFAIKVGRTELVYDDGRLLGNSNWGPKGASHDVAIAQWENESKGYRGDFGFAINNTAPASAFLASYPLKNYKYMAYLYEQKKFYGDKLTISFLGILDVMQKPNSVNKILRNDTLYVVNTNHDTIGTTVIPTITPVTTSYPTQLYGRLTKSTAFSTLYPTSHGFYGYMDMFSSLMTTGEGAGLTDLYARATFKLGGKTSLEATYRYFGLAQGYLPITISKPGEVPYIAVKKHLGSEIDLMAIYKPVKNFEINAAYCFFIPTSTMERLNSLKEGTSKWAQYAYIMLTYKPNFFTSEKH